jgi:hypothetical protein
MKTEVEKNYTPNEVQEIVDSVSSDYEKQLQKGGGSSMNYGMATLGSHQNSIVEWQLDLSKELELIYHQLRGHIIVRDEDGKEDWDDPKKKVLAKIVEDENGIKYWINTKLSSVIKTIKKDTETIYDYDEGRELYEDIVDSHLEFVEHETMEVIDYDQKLLNEKGAQEIEKIIRNYLNKNLLLSNFKEEMIRERVGEFAHRLRRFIYLNYEEFGLDTYYKQKHFEMLTMNIVDIIEAAYNRALNGEERESLTTVRQIVQTESIDNKPQSAYGQPQIQRQQGSRMNPLNWFR